MRHTSSLETHAARPYGFTHAISHETILHVRYTQNDTQGQRHGQKVAQDNYNPTKGTGRVSLLSVDGFAHRHVECHMPFVACVLRLSERWLRRWR